MNEENPAIEKDESPQGAMWNATDVRELEPKYQVGSPFQMQGVQDLRQVGDVDPKEAAENINEAKELDLTPDNYEYLKPSLKPKVEAERGPQSVPANIAEQMGQSRQHASVMKPDLARLDTASRYMSFFSETIKGKDLGRDVSELSYRRAMGEELSPEENFQLNQLNSKLQELHSAEEYGYNFWESLPAELGGVTYDFARGIWEGKDLVAGGTGIGAGYGAAMGSPAGLPGAGVGAVVGGATGFFYGIGAAQIRDTFRQSTGQIYNDLTRVIRETDEVKLPTAEAERIAIAKGGGVIMAGLSLLPVGVIAKKIPWVNRFVNPRSFLKYALSPSGSKFRELAKALAQSGAAEGFEEGAQEIVQIFAKEIGATWDGTDTQFMEGIKNAAKKYQEYAPQVAKAGTIGAVAGTAFTGVGRAAGAAKEIVSPTKIVAPKEVPIKPTRKRVDEVIPSNLPTRVKGTRSIQLKIALDQVGQVTKETQMNETVPEEIDILRQRIFNDAGISDIYVDKDDLTKWADNEDKAAKVRSILSPRAMEDAKINAPLRIEASKFLRLRDEFPDITNLAKADPDGLTAGKFMERVKAADEARVKIEEQKPAPLPEGTPIEKRITDKDIFEEDDYHAQETFTEKMYDVIPKSEALKVNEAQLNARVAVADAINAENEKQMNQVLDLDVEMALAFEREFQTDEAERDKNIKLVESYLDNSRVVDPSPEMQKRMDSGRPAFQINPETLPPRLRNKYLDDVVLKERKVFAKDGMDYEDVMVAMGVKNPTHLLMALASVPTTEQYVENQLALREESIKQEARTNLDFDESAISKAYHNMTKNHLKEMKVLLSKDWSAVKAGIKRIALPLPKISQLVTAARNRIGNTRVKDLNVAQYVSGEKKSQNKAVRAILDNKVEEAFSQKENAAFNSELARATHVTIGKINRATKWVTKLYDPEVRAELKEAGKLYEDAIDYFLDAYNFDPSKKNQSKIEGYKKFVAKMLESGNGDFSIPVEVEEWLTPANNAKNLTADQYLYVVDKMRAVLHQARLKNQLLGKYLDGQEQMTVEMIAESAVDAAKLHPDYSEKNMTKPQGNISAITKVMNGFRLADDLMKNMQSIVQQLDQQLFNGYWAKMIWQPMDGTGIHEGIYGRKAKIEMNGAIKKEFDAAVKKYGKSEWRRLGIKKITVPEFASIPGLNNGKLTKLDLMVMAMNIGNSENIEALENFGVERDTIFQVLEKNLTVKDMDFIQNSVWGVFKKLKPRIAALEKITTGLDLEFVEPESFTMFGKEFDGGYFPIHYKWDTNSEVLISENDSKYDAADPKQKGMGFRVFTHGVVKSPHTKERKGAKWQVDLGIETFALSIEDTVHDLTMRVPVRDTMAFLKNADVAKAVTGILGIDRYNTLVNTVAEQTNSLTAEGIRLYSNHQKTIANGFNYLQGVAATNYIMFNPNSVIMSSLSIPQTINRMGVKNASKYLTYAILKMTNPLNWKNAKQFQKVAADLDPTIGSYFLNVDDFAGQALIKSIPKKRAFKNRPYHMVKNIQENMSNFAFSGILGGIDTIWKSVVSIANYAAYMNGDIEGHPLSAIEQMTPEERHLNAKAYVAQFSSGTLMANQSLDKASIQKSFPMKIFTPFWNEQRNAINNRIGDFRSMRQRAKSAVSAAKEGDYVGAGIAIQDNGAQMARMITTSVLGLAILKATKDGISSLFAEDEDDEETLADGFFGNVLAVSNEMLLSNIPVVRDLIYVTKRKMDFPSSNAGVTPPVMALLTDAAVSGAATYQLLQGLNDELTLIEASEELSEQQVRSVLNTMGIFLGGIPTSAIFRYYKMLQNEDGELEVPNFPSGLLEGTVENLDAFIEKHDESQDDSPEMQFARLRARMTGDQTQLQQAVDQAKELRAKLDPLPQGEVLADEDYEVIKHAESNGKWNARPRKKDGSLASSAFGLYQITAGTWRRLMNHPEGRKLGLTEMGRLSKNPKQQEKAMRLLTRINAGILQKNGVPVNLETLYFAHHFGPQYAEKVYKAPEKKRIAIILNPRVAKANPQLANKWVRTAGDMRRYIRNALDRGRKATEESGG